MHAVVICSDAKHWWNAMMACCGDMQWWCALMRCSNECSVQVNLWHAVVRFVMRCMVRPVLWWHAIMRCNGAMQWSDAMWFDAVRICYDDAMLNMQCDAMQWGYAMMMQCWTCNAMRCSEDMQWWCNVVYAVWCDAVRICNDDAMLSVAFRWTGDMQWYDAVMWCSHKMS